MPLHLYLYTVSEDRIKANANVLPLSLNAEHILSKCVTIETYTELALKLFLFFPVACIAI